MSPEAAADVPHPRTLWYVHSFCAGNRMFLVNEVNPMPSDAFHEEGFQRLNHFSGKTS